TLGRIAGAVLSSSMLVLGAFWSAAFAVASLAWRAAPAAGIVLLYLLQLHYLNSIGRHPAKRRLLTWQLSLLAHFIVAAVAYLAFRSSVVFVLLLPEAVSAAVHIVGIRHASRCFRGA